jgi:hypothetical protein
MITLLQWPPSGLNFRCHNTLFEWQGTEAFIEPGDPNGGWVGKIQNYGRANSLPEEQWSEQTIYAALARMIPEVMRGSYFAMPKELPGVDLSVPKGTAHWSPLASSLERTSKLVFPNLKWDAVAAEKVVADFKPSDWIKVLRRWRTANPVASSSKTVAGPVWWYAIHCLAANCDAAPGGACEVQTWVNFWHGAFPCDQCRYHFTKCPVERPQSWADLKRYADEAHKWVTANK